MRNILTIVVMTLSLNSFAGIEAYNYTSSTGKNIKLTDASVEKLWNTKTPACLKRGGKLLKMNKAFKEMGLKAGDCSNTDNAREEQKLLGYSVNVIQLRELSASMVKQFGL